MIIIMGGTYACNLRMIVSSQSSLISDSLILQWLPVLLANVNLCGDRFVLRGQVALA